jgi:hypothetical protein
LLHGSLLILDLRWNTTRRLRVLGLVHRLFGANRRAAIDRTDEMATGSRGVVHARGFGVVRNASFDAVTARSHVL